MRKSMRAMWVTAAVGAAALVLPGCTGEGVSNDALAQLVGGNSAVAGAQSAASAASLSAGKDTAPVGGLQLTDEQKTQAAAIFKQLRTDLDALRDATDAQIRAVLTEEQAAKFDQRPRRGPGVPGGPGFGTDASAEEIAAQVQRHVDVLTRKLDLTADQQASISATLTDSRSKAGALHDQTVASFRTLLTADQQAVFDAMQKDGRFALGPPFGPGRPHDGPPGARLAEKLNLTADQIAQADAIRDQAHTDIEALREAAHTQIRALLTEEQAGKFDALTPPAFDGPPPFGPRGRGAFARALGRPGPGGPPPPLEFGGEKTTHLDRLADALGLSAEQKASIATILDDLHAAVQARHEDARAAFRALLTEEQTAILDAAN